MTKPAIKRCAIYTRKSHEEGLEQDFNSLHAQREASAAYIISQKHEGWQEIKAHYDDGGFSGGTMERPALKQLMEDIEAGKVDVIVVYKVDRLSRSLHDFARMVEVFDKHGVSFISVTQAFNTTSSMGRLTLNVLLSFAQFEREVTGERIRDKIAASKKKGIWMGGFVPLGYDAVERKLLINAQEAKTVRYIYQRYLNIGSVRLLKEDLDKQGFRSKVRGQKAGCSFSRGILYKILSNPIYIGQIRHKDVCHPGQHEPIIDQALWDEVEQRIIDNRIGDKKPFCKTERSPLTGKLFDVSGERLVPVHANKKGRRYRYYISQSITQSPKDKTSSNDWRLPGQEIEQVIAHAATGLLHNENAIITALRESQIAAHHIPGIIGAAKKVQCNASDIIDRFIQRAELHQGSIRLTLTLLSLIPVEANAKTITITNDIPILIKRRGVEMRLVINADGPARTDSTLIKTIVRAHKWFDDIITGRAKNMAEIASQEGTEKSYVAKVMNLAFLAPDIIESIIAGRQPADLTVERLTKHIDLPLDWTKQRQLLGFS